MVAVTELPLSDEDPVVSEVDEEDPSDEELLRVELEVVTELE